MVNVNDELMLINSFWCYLQRCQAQISSTASMAQADSHFRAVCRALVAETLEFSDFLAKVTSGQSNDESQ